MAEQSPDPKSAPTFKRRKVLVDPELQIGLSTEMVGWIYVYFMAFAVLANLPHIVALIGASPEEAAYLSAMDHIRSFASSVVLPMGITFVAMAVHGVYMTHRIAGPMVRFKRSMREIAARRLPRAIGLRPKDHFKDLADEMNAAMAVLREDGVRRKRMADDALATVQKLVTALERQPGNTRDTVNLAHAAMDEIETLARHLTTTADGDAPAARPVPLAEADLPAVVSVDMDDIDAEPLRAAAAKSAAARSEASKPAPAKSAVASPDAARPAQPADGPAAPPKQLSSK